MGEACSSGYVERSNSSQLVLDVDPSSLGVGRRASSWRTSLPSSASLARARRSRCARQGRARGRRPDHFVTQRHGWTAGAGTTVGHARATVEAAARLTSSPTTARPRCETESCRRCRSTKSSPPRRQIRARSGSCWTARGVTDSGAQGSVRPVRAAACPDEAARYQAIHESRSLRHGETSKARAAAMCADSLTPRPGSSLPPAVRARFPGSGGSIENAGRRGRSGRHAFDGAAGADRFSGRWNGRRAVVAPSVFV